MFRPPTAAATVIFRLMRDERRRDGVLGYEHVAGLQGKLRLPGRSVSLWARGGSPKRHSPRPGPSQTFPAFPTFPGMRTPIRLDRGMWGKRGMVRPVAAGATVFSLPDAGPQAPRWSARL